MRAGGGKLLLSKMLQSHSNFPGRASFKAIINGDLASMALSLAWKLKRKAHSKLQNGTRIYRGNPQ